MSYCVAMLLDTGLVFLSDSRTSAGVDHISTFRKTFIFQKPRERAMVIQTAGNLAITQAVLSLLRERIDTGAREHLLNCINLFEAARCVGDAMREVHNRDSSALKDFGVDFNASLILGGQVRGEEPRLFNIYPAGNFIEATPETTYFQIGESKYGKPIIDRIIRRSSSLNEAIKCALVSMDSTMRSNLSVGPPFDLAVIQRDRCEIARHVRIDMESEYFNAIRGMWGSALREVFTRLPEPDVLKNL